MFNTYYLRLMSVLRLSSLVALVALIAAPSSALALQVDYAPLVLKHGDVSLKINMWNQVWTRVIQNNPGTILRGGAEDEWSADIGIRRSRLQLFGELGSRARILIHFGLNNHSFLNNEFNPQVVRINQDPEAEVLEGTVEDTGPNFFVHDAWTEFTIIDSEAFNLDFGGGLMVWNGISRLTNQSTLNFLAVDAPLTNWPLINGNDQFTRQLGLYIKGDALSGFFDYRIAVTRPFPTSRGGQNPDANTFATTGYLKMQFLEKESNVLPYVVGSYHGEKQVFNLGAGWYFQPEAGVATGDEETDDVMLFGMDVFLDTPLGKEGKAGALTAYSALWLYDFGSTAYVVPIGIMPLSGTVDPEQATLNGAFNRHHKVGHGIAGYVQTGYLLPRFSDVVQLQPYVTAQINQWTAFESLTPVLEGGINFLLESHHAKLTLHYRARPLVVEEEDGDDVFDGFASEFIFQTMVFL